MYNPLLTIAACRPGPPASTDRILILGQDYVVVGLLSLDGALHHLRGCRSGMGASVYQGAVCKSPKCVVDLASHLWVEFSIGLWGP